MRNRGVPYSELPSEVLTTIADRLETQTDRGNFLLVCKQWHTSASLCTRYPKKPLPPLLPSEFSCYEHTFSLRPYSIYLVQSSINLQLSPWLCTVESINTDRFDLCDRPFEIAKTFPEYFPKSFDVLPYRVKEMGRFYKIDRGVYNKYSSKVVLILDPNCRTFPRIEDFNAIVLTKKKRYDEDYDYDLELIVIKQKRNYLITGPCNVRRYDDVVHFKGSIFVIDRKGRGYTISFNEWELRLIVPGPVGKGSGSDRTKRLVVSRTGELYLVSRCPPNSKAIFNLYKLNEETNTWDSVDGIGVERILVVTSGRCFFAMAKDFPGWKGNCIVFCIRDFPTYHRGVEPEFGQLRPSWYNGKMRDTDTIVYNFDDGDCKRVDLFEPPPWILPPQINSSDDSGSGSDAY